MDLSAYYFKQMSNKTWQYEMAAVSCGTSHITIKQCGKYTTSVDIQKQAIKR